MLSKKVSAVRSQRPPVGSRHGAFFTPLAREGMCCWSHTDAPASFHRCDSVSPQRGNGWRALRSGRNEMRPPKGGAGTAPVSSASLAHAYGAGVQWRKP